MARTKVNSVQAAQAVKKHLGGRIFKQGNEAKLYIGSGYLLFRPETSKSAQVQYYLKSYEITPEIENVVTKLNEQAEIV